MLEVCTDGESVPYRSTHSDHTHIKRVSGQTENLDNPEMSWNLNWAQKVKDRLRRQADNLDKTCYIFIIFSLLEKQEFWSNSIEDTDHWSGKIR